MAQSAPALASVIESVRPLSEAGASLHWLNAFDHVDEDGVKRGKTPRLAKWSEAPHQNLEDLKNSYRNRSNIGVRLGEPSCLSGFYLHIIDLDIRKDALANEAWAALLAIFPDAKRFPNVISGSGGESRHIYLLTEKPFRKRKLAKSKTHMVVWDEARQKHVTHNDWEIDLMGTGSQAVIPPSLHPDTHLPYRWAVALDLDMLDLGIGPIVPVATVESWGAKVAAADEDDDDLETLLNNSPLDLSEDEIDDILANIPNDAIETIDGKPVRVGAHYDDYIEVGMALHHQYQGDEHGFQKWIDWAEQSDKFNLKHARYRWDKSFGGTKNPVRMPTLIHKANIHRLAQELDFELETDDDEFDLGPDPAPAPAPFDPSLDDLLGDAPMATAATPMPAPAAAKVPVVDSNWQSLFHLNEDGDLKSTSHNIGLILANDTRLFGAIGFNEFLQEIVIRAEPRRIKKKRQSAKAIVNLDSHLWEQIDPLNGTTFTDSHESAIRMLIEAPTTQGGYGIKVSDRDLRAAIDAAANRWRFHPVKMRLEQTEWDGVKRMEHLFIDYLGAANTPYHREIAAKMLVAAVARIYEPGHKFDSVVILEGVQGKRKSTFIETLAFGWFAELEGDLHDRKAMVEKMQGAWILEIPELQGFSKAEVNTIKGFVTSRHDKVRMAYARRAVAFYRQCIFMGSTNDDQYLRDPTGGRRFWPVHCAIETEIDISELERNLAQIWAEAVHNYRLLRTMLGDRPLPLYLNSEDAAQEALLMQASRTQESPEQILAGEITAWLDTPIDDGTGFDDLDADAPKVFRTETCIAQIWREMMGRQVPMQHGDTMRIGAALKFIGWERSAGPVLSSELNRKYGKTRVYTRPD